MTESADQMINRPDVKKYLEELAVDIVEHGGLQGKTLNDAMCEAHARRQAFALELVNSDSDRAKMAKKAVGASIWISVQAQKAKESFLYDCELLDQKSL